MRSLVSCTGAQFCNFALIETKNRALSMIKSLESELTLSRPVRIHWTGCPNSCGQPQVADIGLMGTKARKNGKMSEGVDNIGIHKHALAGLRKFANCTPNRLLKFISVMLLIWVLLIISGWKCDSCARRRYRVVVQLSFRLKSQKLFLSVLSLYISTGVSYGQMMQKLTRLPIQKLVLIPSNQN